MTDKVLSVAEYNMMPRITPTQAAEEAYAAKLRQNQPQPIGPAGIPIPLARSIYRPTMDGKLLGRISRVAYDAHCASVLNEARTAEIVAVLVADLDRRFPAADMAVLERYGFAVPTDLALIDLQSQRFNRTLRLALPHAMMLPRQVARWHMDLGSPYPTSFPPVPVGAEPYCRLAVDLELMKSGTGTVAMWPGSVKTATGRWPRWLEIEREFPMIGNWLAEQREGMAA